MKTISQRASALIANPSPIVVGHMKCFEDPYSLENPNGYLNFGIAQNHLVENEMENFIRNNNKFTKGDIHYNAGHGKESLRIAFSNFANQILGTPKLEPNHITIQTGVSSLCESLSYCLFDEGDTLLMAAPYYSGFIYDFARRFKVDIKLVQLKESNNFEHKYIDFFTQIELTNPKAVLITHPYNPTGEVLSKSFLDQLVNACKEKNIHIISDEVYALSHIDGQKHQSLLQYDYDKVHFLYGMAKDFTLAGLRMGFFYTKDEELSSAMQTVSYFHTTSTQTQNSIEALLNNNVFIEDVTRKNQTRIKQTYDKIRTNLPKLKHIEPKAGIFFLANLKELLRANTQEAEQQLFNMLINDVKINMTPGSAMGMDDYGYFRVCFAKEDSHIDEFIKRMTKLLK